MKKCILALIVLTCLSTVALAQTKHKTSTHKATAHKTTTHKASTHETYTNGSVPAADLPKAQLGGTFQLSHGGGTWFKGGGADVGFPIFYHGQPIFKGYLGGVVDLGISHGSGVTPMTITVGTRFQYRQPKYEFIWDVLWGVGHTSAGGGGLAVGGNPNGGGGSTNFAFGSGVGLNYKIKPNLYLRVPKFDFMYSGGSSVRIGFGVVYNFKR